MNATACYDDFGIESRIGFRRRWFSPRELPEHEIAAPGLSWGRMVETERPDRFLLYCQWIPDMQQDWERGTAVLEASSPLGFAPDAIRATRRLIDERRDGGSPGRAGETPALVPSVFVSLDRSDHREGRFKALMLHHKSVEQAWGTIATSPDGVHWTDHPEYRFCSHYPDTMASIHFNETTGRYVIYYRAALTDRRMHATVSTDLVDWDEPRLILAPDPADEPGTQIYGMVVYDADGYFVGLPQIFLTDPRDPVTYKMAGVVDSDFAWSYDGLYWTRAHASPPIARRLPGEYGHGGVYCSSIVTDPESGDWIIGTNEAMTQHGFGYKPAYPDTEVPPDLARRGVQCSRLYRIRRDGFVGFEACAHRANLTFTAFDLLSERLYLNVRTAPYGRLRCRITEADGGEIPGFGFEDAVPFAGDSTEHTPRWREHTLAEIVGRQVRLEVEAYEAVIFALRGDFRPHHGYHSQHSWGRPAAL